jgi:replicative DNA helicase
MNQESIDNKLWSLSAEGGVIGSAILDKNVMSKALAILPDEKAFFEPKHQQIFAALLALYAEGKPTDAICLRDELERRGQLEGIGGVPYIVKILDSVPSSANAEYYARIVREKAEYRQLVGVVEDIQKTLDEPLAVAEQTEQIQRLAIGLSSARKKADSFSLSEDATDVAVKAWDRDIDIIRTGFRNIDRIIAGIGPGELIIVAARPSMGKSALVLGMALNMARDGRSVVFITLEMTGRALIERAISMTGGVNLQTIKMENPPKEKLDDFYGAALLLKKYDLTFREGITTAEKIVAAVEAQNRIRSVDCVVVDYLQLMSGGRNKSRYEEITNISGSLKRAALRLHVPLIAVSQLNREVEGREHHRPRMSDLRDSGALEQDADVVMLLHREDYYRRYENKNHSDFDGLAELVVAKNRRGPCGVANLTFLNEYVSFGDLSEGQDNE